MSASRFIAPSAEDARIFVASLRAGAGSEALETRRSNTLSYSVQTVAIPPQRPPGRVTPDTNINPKIDFTVRGSTGFADFKDMTKALKKAASDLGRPGEVMVFVHGYKNSFVHGIKRIAELDTDYHAPIVKLLFDWPSDDELLNYAHDLDSAAFSRDGLEELVTGLSSAGFKRIVLVGYSMGAEIVMETLRQMRIGGKDAALQHIGGIALIAPDIDMALFTQNVKRVLPLPVPFTVYSSRSDWPLRSLQRYVYADRPRLGTVADLTAIAHLPITLVTVEAEGNVAEANHLATTSPSIMDAANALGVDIAAFGPLAKTAPDAEVTVFGRAVRVDLP